MKEGFTQRFRQSGLEFLGCHRGGDGHCYYLCGKGEVTRDYGDKIGRGYWAFRDDGREGLDNHTFVVVEISNSALATQRIQHLIGDPATYLKRAGVAHLKALLDSGAEKGTEHRIILNSESADADFAIPTTMHPRLLDRRLREELIQLIAAGHDQKQKRVPLDGLYEQVCADRDAFDRAIRILISEKLIHESTEHGGPKLTEKGWLAAEAAIAATGPVLTSRNAAKPVGTVAPAAPQFHFFVSYAGEDRPMVKELVKSLTSQDQTVWWDKGQIKLGDRLTAKIEEGLRLSRYGLVIVSPHFVAKRWPEAEIRAFAHRAINTGQKVILPVLYDLTHEQFAATYPLLADIVSTTFTGDYDTLVNEIVEAVAP
jgi:hypothetical protein